MPLPGARPGELRRARPLHPEAVFPQVVSPAAVEVQAAVQAVTAAVTVPGPPRPSAAAPLALARLLIRVLPV